MIKNLSLPIGEQNVILRFDLGTTYIFNDLVSKNPATGAFAGIDEAIHMIYAGYLRQLAKANATAQDYTEKDIRESCMDMHMSELRPYAEAFNAILVTSPIPGLEEPIGGATAEEKKSE